MIPADDDIRFIWKVTFAFIGVALGHWLSGCALEVDDHEAPPSYCEVLYGDVTCEHLFPDGSRPYCVSSDCTRTHRGCVAEIPEPHCAQPCGDSDPECGATGSPHELLDHELASSDHGPVPRPGGSSG